MRIPTVEKCCCGCNLRLGSAIIGVLFFLSGLSQTISYSVQASNANEEGDSKATFIISAIMAALMLLSTGVLLFGVHKERAGLLRPWLIVYGILVCISVAIFLIGAIVAFAIGALAAGAIFLVVGLVFAVLYAYCLVVVYSYYLSLTGVQPGTV